MNNQEFERRLLDLLHQMDLFHQRVVELGERQVFAVNRNERRIKAVRVIEVEGDETWVLETLAGSYLQPGDGTPPSVHPPRRLEEVSRTIEVVAERAGA